MKTREEKILEWVNGSSILDIGCTDHIVRDGSVYWLHKHLSENFSDVVGIDISEENLQKMRSLGYQKLFNMNAESFSFDQQFDTIVAGELIEHLSNPGLFLDKARSHLSSNGRLIITTPYAFTVLYVLYATMKFPKTCENAEHTHWLCIETMRNLAARHGFKERHFELVADYRLDNSSWKYRIFARIMLYLGFFIPKQWRNNVMLFVFEPA